MKDDKKARVVSVGPHFLFGVRSQRRDVRDDPRAVLRGGPDVAAGAATVVVDIH